MEFGPLVRKLDRLYPLSDGEKQILEDSCQTIVSFEAHHDIIAEGDTPTSCNLLLDGMVCRYVTFTDGKRQILSFHTPGDIFDAQSFLIERMDHTVGTLSECTIAVLPHAILKRITEEYPRVARAVWKDTLVDAAIFRQWIVSIGRRSAYQRIAHLMCEIYFRLDVVGRAGDGTIFWPLTQADLADAVSLSPVHANRTLQELRQAGLIDFQRNRLQILDWPGLARAGDFDPNYLHLSDLPAGPGVPDAKQRGSVFPG